MNRSVSFRRLAQTDVDSALDWYGKKRPALALAFAAALDGVVRRIRESPSRFPVVHGQIRRALLGRFPYGVFFVESGETIHVLAVVHLHRRPSVWKKRT